MLGLLSLCLDNASKKVPQSFDSMATLNQADIQKLWLCPLKDFDVAGNRTILTPVRFSMAYLKAYMFQRFQSTYESCLKL